MKNNKQISCEQGELTLRPYNEEDVRFYADYMYNSPEEFLKGIGYEPSKFPPRAAWEIKDKEWLSEEVAKNALPNILAVELKGITIAIIKLDRRNSDGIARLHFHIFVSELRGKGLGKVILAAGITQFRELHGINKFLIEPNTLNKPMNALMRKMGFNHVKDYTHTAGLLTRELLVSQYEIIPPTIAKTGL